MMLVRGMQRSWSCLQDWVQQQQRHKAALEVEIKTLRSQIGEGCFAFDDSLIELQLQRNAADSELTTAELQRVSLTASYEQQQNLQSELQKVAEQLSRVQQQLDVKHALADDVTQALVKSVPGVLLHILPSASKNLCKVADNKCSSPTAYAQRSAALLFHAIARLFCSTLLSKRTQETCT